MNLPKSVRYVIKLWCDDMEGYFDATDQDMQDVKLRPLKQSEFHFTLKCYFCYIAYKTQNTYS